MAEDTIDFEAQVRAAAQQIRALLDFTVDDAPLLAILAVLDEAERDLRTVRDSVLVAVREQGRSWNDIASNTGVAATTWRGRHERFTEEAIKSC